jgi:ribosomal protein S24E
MNISNYVCLTKNNYTFKNYQLIPIRIQDAESIRKWRNEQITFLRQEKVISSDEQQQYFEQTITPSYTQQTPDLILFSFLENSTLIGYGGFVNINWDKKISEISFLIETKRSKNPLLYRNDFSIFLNFIKKIICDELKFKELFTETYDIRPDHIVILEKNKFKISKRENNIKIIEEKPVNILFHSYICGKDGNV